MKTISGYVIVGKFFSNWARILLRSRSGKVRNISIPLFINTCRGFLAEVLWHLKWVLLASKPRLLTFEFYEFMRNTIKNSNVSFLPCQNPLEASNLPWSQISPTKQASRTRNRREVATVRMSDLFIIVTLTLWHWVGKLVLCCAESLVQWPCHIYIYIGKVIALLHYI